MIENICEKKDCTGCKLCGDICPVGAISFETDKHGFWYPKISEKCIECKQCIKQCPVASFTENMEGDFLKVYSAYAKDDNLRLHSTSGGIFGTIAQEYIKAGGVVVGCVYGEDWRSAKHIIADDEYSIDKIIGSKYFQSDTSNIYIKLKKVLESGRRVLFCGTPCQVAAARRYLGKYEDITYIDFICRSINSPLAFKKYIEELEEIYHSKVSKVHLKNKDLGWQSLATKVYFENGEFSLKDKNVDYWIRGFITKGLYTRPSCNNCKFREIPHRYADLTLGDFWGIQNQTDENMMKGISVVLVDSKKGFAALDLVKENLILDEYKIEDVLPGNTALKNDPQIAEKQEMFFDLLSSNKFSYCVQKCSYVSPIKRIIGKLKRIINR